MSFSAIFLSSLLYSFLQGSGPSVGLQRWTTYRPAFRSFGRRPAHHASPVDLFSTFLPLRFLDEMNMPPRPFVVFLTYSHRVTLSSASSLRPPPASTRRRLRTSHAISHEDSRLGSNREENASSSLSSRVLCRRLVLEPRVERAGGDNNGRRRRGGVRGSLGEIAPLLPVANSTNQTRQ